MQHTNEENDTSANHGGVVLVNGRKTFQKNPGKILENDFKKRVGTLLNLSSVGSAKIIRYK